MEEQFDRKSESFMEGFVFGYINQKSEAQSFALVRK